MRHGLAPAGIELVSGPGLEEVDVSKSHVDVTRWSVVGAVVVLHLLGLWALQQGLLQRVVEWVVPVMAVSDPSPDAPPMPMPAPPPPVQSRSQPVVPRGVAPPVSVVPPELPVTMVPGPVPSAMATLSAASAVPSLPAPQPVALVNATPAPSPVLALPSTQADYLNNPKPAYPALSRRLGEQGRAVVRVLIGADGLPQKAELHTSSGFDRLDRAALETVMRWRYVPGKRGDVPETMWFNVPMNFVLE